MADATGLCLALGSLVELVGGRLGRSCWRPDATWGKGEGPWGLETHVALGSDRPVLFPPRFLHLTLGP